MTRAIIARGLLALAALAVLGCGEAPEAKKQRHLERVTRYQGEILENGFQPPALV